MSKINLTRGYFVTVSDDGCYTLMRRYMPKANVGRQPKDGQKKEVERAVGFYSTLTGAVLGARKKAQADMLAKDEELSLAEAVVLLRGLDKEFRFVVEENKLDVGAKVFL